MIRILLVDDHAVVRAGYQRFLERTSDIVVAAEAADAEQAYDLFCREAPDVSVIDLSMPGAGGIDLIGRIASRQPTARTLAFSMHDDPLFATRALQAGAQGYVTKNSAPETLVEAIRAVHAGNTFISPDIAQRLVLGHAEANPLAALSAKEFEVFRLLAEGHSVADVAATLNLSQKTAANYQTLIKDKLEARTTAALVHIALRHGVIKAPES